MPTTVYEILLSVLCVGIVFFISWKGIRRGFVLSARLMLVELVTILYCSTLLFRRAEVTSKYDWKPFWSYKAIEEGRIELLPENIMNVMVFVPIGLLLCLAFQHIKWWQVLIVGGLVSLSIEVIQLVTKRGFAETDDVMHNTLGCMIGYGLYKLVQQISLKVK